MLSWPDYLGYGHGEPTSGSDMWNGIRTGMMLIQIGSMEIEVLRARGWSFAQVIVSKRKCPLGDIG